MIPINTAWSLYDGDDAKFREDLKWHFRHGLVYSDKRIFLMARPVRWMSPGMLNPTIPPSGDSDTWFVWMAVGHGALGHMLDLAPYALPYVAFTRHRNQDEVKRYNWDRLYTLTHGLH